MAWTITDSGRYIIFDDGILQHVAKKVYIETVVSGDIVSIYWHVQELARISRRLLEIDWNDVTTPVVVSAADLETKILAMVTTITGLVIFSQLTLVSGAINGINTVFRWSSEPLQIFWQGQKLVHNALVNGYTLSGTDSTHTEAPMTGDNVEAYGNI
jgi:hypothetical protein